MSPARLIFHLGRPVALGYRKDDISAGLRINHSARSSKMEIPDVNQLRLFLIRNERKILLVKLPDPIEHLDIRPFPHRADKQEMFVHPLLVTAKGKKNRSSQMGPR